MTRPARLLLLLLAPLFLLQPASAQNAGDVREFKDMLKDIPSKEMLKLWSDKKAEVALSITRQIETREVGKVGTYRGKVTKIDPYSFRNENLVGWRLGVEESFKRGGDTLLVFSWVMVHTDPNGLIPKIRLGDEITVTGTVNRAELTANDNPRLNVDLIVPVMNNGKGAAEKAPAAKPAAAAAAVPAAPAVMPAPAPAPAAAAAAPVQTADYPLDRILDALPAASRATLSTAPLADESIPALNTALSTLALRKPFTFTFKTAAAAPLPKSPERFQIRAAPGLLSGKYPAIQQHWVHLYLPTAGAAEIAKAGIGAPLTMSGTITRIDIITTPQGIRQLQLNLEDAQLLTPP